MIRYFSVTLCTFVCALAIVLAQDPQDGAKPKEAAPKQDKKDEGDKGDLKKEDAKQPEPAPGEKPENPQEIIQRLRENFEKAREGLEKKDPLADTRNTQNKIIEDLDKLQSPTQ